MRRTLSILLALLVISCNPYRQIAGDQNRKPFERKILLQECAIEAPPSIPDPSQTPPPTYDSAANKEYINQLESGIRQAQEEYNQLFAFTDSVIGKSAAFDSLKNTYLNSISKLKGQIKNAPPITKEVKVPWENTAKISLLTDEITKLRRELGAKDITIDKANASKEKAEEDKKEAEKYKIYFWGLVVAVLVAAGIFLYIKIKK